MIARLYGSLVILQLLLLGWLGWQRVAGGLSGTAETVVWAVQIMLIVASVVPVTTCGLSRIRAFQAPPELRIGVIGAVRWFIGEWLAFLALFTLIQPLERLFMGDDTAAPAPNGRSPLLLVHGYMCNRGFWWWIRRALEASGFAVGTINLEPPFGDMDGFAAQLHDRIEALRRETGAATVHLVCHSMGGLVARGYMKRYGHDAVASLTTLGTPHVGTRLALLGLGRNAVGMRPGSAWLKSAHPKAPPVPTLSFWSTWDNFIIPQDGSRLDGAREHIVTGLGHLAMAFSTAVLAAIIGEVERVEAERAGAAA